MADITREKIELDISQPIWDRFFYVVSLVIIGTLEEDGSYDLAPKHMAIPIGWENYFGFVCSPTHATQTNVKRSGEFTVTYPRPEQLLQASLSASPRMGETGKPALSALSMAPAHVVNGVLVDGGYVELECELDRILDGFGPNSLIIGRIVAARVAEDALRSMDGDDADLVHHAPLLAYLSPGRFATIDQSLSFPFPAGMRK
jgi:flavin reductase (DIM6/NTAB) family NADH-FMN oxidoreductase RutF